MHPSIHWFLPLPFNIPLNVYSGKVQCASVHWFAAFNGVSAYSAAQLPVALPIGMSAVLGYG